MAYPDPNPPASPEAVAALLDAAIDPCDRALIALVGRAGLRPREACALRIDHVRAGGRAIVAPCSSGPLQRVVTLAPAVRQAVLDACGSRSVGAALLVSPDGKEFNPALAVRRLADLGERAGIQGPVPTPPQLRAFALASAPAI